MARVFFDTRLNFHKILADYTALASDSGKTFLCNPTATAAITLPAVATAGEGWNCKIVITEDTDGTVGGMDAILNVAFSDGDIVGLICSQSDVAGDYAVNGDTHVNFTAAASPGDFIECWTDGSRWYVSGMAVDATPGTGDVLFNSGAAS